MRNKYMIHYTYNEVYSTRHLKQKVEKKDFTFFTESEDFDVEDRCAELCDIFVDFCVINICKL